MSIEERAYDKMWDLNVKSIFFLIQESLHLLKKGGKEANVLVVSSVGGKNPAPLIGVYSMTKAALDNMVIFLSKELIDEDIRVNAIAPGVIKTEFSGPLWKGNEALPEKAQGTSEEIASVVATITSKDGSFMNGEVY